MDTRFIRILQRDIVTKPEQWANGKPGKFIKLSNRAKNVYCVLSVIAYSSAGNARETTLKNNHTFGKNWFWTSHRLLQQLTGSSQKTVQRGIKELCESGLIEYHASKAQGQKSYFKIKRVKYKDSKGSESKTTAPKSTKQKFSKEEDEYILEMDRQGRVNKLTPAQERRLDELPFELAEPKDSEEPKMPEFPQDLQDDDEQGMLPNLSKKSDLPELPEDWEPEEPKLPQDLED